MKKIGTNVYVGNTIYYFIICPIGSFSFFSLKQLLMKDMITGKYDPISPLGAVSAFLLFQWIGQFAKRK